jgi:Xaa-Pro dipeptidase
MTLSRRAVLGAAAATLATATAAAATAPAVTAATAAAKPPVPDKSSAPAASVSAVRGTGTTANPRATGLTSITKQAQPITVQERNARIDKLQDSMQQKKIGAILIESGTSLEYFTGVRWRQSERITAAIIPATGPLSIVTPFFESPSIRETLQTPGEVRPWNEDENPFELIVRILQEHGLAGGVLAIDAMTRFFVVDSIAKASGGKLNIVAGNELVRACRMFKSPAELALMQIANDVTLAALRYVHRHVELGMQTADISNLMEAATVALGGGYDFSLALLNEASAYPHGSIVVQRVRKGSVILMDCGCTVHGYQSDISRSWVFGSQPTARQRQVWNTVKRGQEIALESARLGVPVGSIDVAVRSFYEQQGWSRNYALPGLSHRTGHGIGLDGHESPYLVRNDTTPLQAGMCFSDEPGIYIPGEFGIRLEDCWHMTEEGPKLFTPLAKSIDDPV